ncbi:16770_t:CDS:2, partial [Funneliformis geosporum]
YWETVSTPTLLSFLEYRKKAVTERLFKEQEHLRYQKDLETIVSFYVVGTNWSNIATLAINNLKNEKTSSQVNDFWSLELEGFNYEAVTSVEQKKLELLKTCGKIQAYQTGNNYLLRTSTIVEKMNLNNLDESSDGHDNIINHPNDIISMKNPFLENSQINVNTGRTMTELETINSQSIGKRAHKDEDHDVTKNIFVDYSKHTLLKTYCKLLFDLQDHHLEEDSQRARHLAIMLEWHVVDYELFNEAGWIENPLLINVSVPCFCFKLVSDVLRQHSNYRLHQAVEILQKLEAKNIIRNNDYDWIPSFTLIKRIFGQGMNDQCYKIDVLTVISVLSTLILYTSTSCGGAGNPPPENHIKSELWASIFSKAFILHDANFVPVWELHHLISGNSVKRNGHEIHKDNIVVVAEAVYEFNRILSLSQNPSEEEVNKARIHIGLVNGTTINFSTIRPIYNQEKSTFIYACENSVLSYNLKTEDIETCIQNVLRLVTYLRETICADALPKLPVEAVKSRISETKFTPRVKRQRNVCPSE